MVEGFEIQGVSLRKCGNAFPSAARKWRLGSLAFEKARGRAPSAAENGVITRQKRNEKMTEISTPAAQTAQLTAAERKELQTVTATARQRGPLPDAANGHFKPEDPTREQAALGAAVAHRFERASVLKGHEVLAEASQP